MTTEELLDFIRKSKVEGHTNEQIKNVLIKNGWTSGDVEEGLKSLEQPKPIANPVPAPEVNIVSKKKRGIFPILVIVFILVVGTSAYFEKDNFKNLPLFKAFSPVKNVAVVIPQDNNILPTNNTVVGNTSTAPVVNDSQDLSLPAPVPESAGSNCDNIDCLISAASKCQPMVAIISSKNPSPLFKIIEQSSKNKYEIKTSKIQDKCTLVFSFVSGSFTMSAENRKKGIEAGGTDAQVNDLLKKMNDSLVYATKVSTICADVEPATIAAYLTDTKNGNANMNFSATLGSGKSTSVFTTSTGKKLTCTSQKK